MNGVRSTRAWRRTPTLDGPLSLMHVGSKRRRTAAAHPTGHHRFVDRRLIRKRVHRQPAASRTYTCLWRGKVLAEMSTSGEPISFTISGEYLLVNASTGRI
jgi:hypothetical protein